MDKASKWFRGLLGLKRPHSPSPSTTVPKSPKEKRRCSFVKSYREKHHTVTATAACCSPTTATPQERAAIKIQAAFRASLARKALRALKGLVKLQALVRGHIERKRTAERLQKVQALLRVQAQILHSPYSNAKSSTAHLHCPATPDKFESPVRPESMKYYQSSSVLKRNSSKSRILNNGNHNKCGNRSDGCIDEQSWNQRRSWTRASSMDEERIRVDPAKPHITSKRRNMSHSCSQDLVSDHYSQRLMTNNSKDSMYYQSGQSVSSSGNQSMNELEWTSLWAADNSPQAQDGVSKRSPFTPTSSRSHQSSYSELEYPSYMAYTESSKAKVRSLSAPRQRLQYERSSSCNRYTLHVFGESKLAAQAHRISALQARFTTKAYPGSGRLDNLGLHVRYK